MTRGNILTEEEIARLAAHPVKNIIFWLLWSCLIGEIWWLIDLFRISDMVDETNEEILGTCIEEAKALYP